MNTHRQLVSFPAILTLVLAAPGGAQTQLAELRPAGLGASDDFGEALAVDGPYLLVGAPDDSDVALWGGSAYIFQRDDRGTPADPLDDTWVERAQLLPSDPAPYAAFGRAVDLSGDTALVGASFPYVMASDPGRAYVFDRDDGGTPADPTDDTWVERAVLQGSDTVVGDAFGSSLALDGDTALIGAQHDDDACPTVFHCRSGSAYVFRRSDGGTPGDPSDDTWSEVEKLTAAEAKKGDLFGRSVDLVADTALIGAPESITGDGGSAYVFERVSSTPETWVQAAQLAEVGKWFGEAVSLSPGAAVVGDQRFGRGVAWVFERDDAGTPADPLDDTWSEVELLTSLMTSSSAALGSAVCIGDDTVLVGAPLDDPVFPSGWQSSAGSCFAFRRDSAAAQEMGEVMWVKLDKLVADDAAPADYLGEALVIADDIAYVGAPGDDDVVSSGGSVYVFHLRPGLPLTGSPHAVSIAIGGTHSFGLDAGVAYAGETYLVVGTTAGWQPSLFLPFAEIPLVPDGPGGYLEYTLANANSGPLVQTFGALDAQGRASAALVVPAGLSPSLSGLTLHHLGVLFDLTTSPDPYVSFASNPVALMLDP